MRGQRRVYLVRHGAVEANAKRLLVGRSDPPLTPAGLAQAKALAAGLAGAPLAAAHSSPLRRAHDTAREIAAPHGFEIGLEPDLVEQSYGQWEGASGSALRADPATAEHFSRWLSDPQVAPPEGESLAAVARRSLEALERILGESSGEVLIVTHTGPLKTLLCAALDLPLDYARRLFLDPGSVSVIDWGKRSILRAQNVRWPLPLDRW